MKKIIKIIIGIVVFLIIACFVATGVLLYNLYDDTNNTPTDIATNNYSTEELINRELTYSFDDSSDIYFELDEKDLNEILYSLSKKFNHMYFKGLGAYVKFEADGSITVELPIQSYFYKTCIKGKLKITLENDTFIFQIIDAKAGRVDFANSFIHNTITRHLKDDEIENNLKMEGFSCDINLSELTISMTKNQILEYLKTFKEKDNNMALYIVLADFCLKNPDVFEFVLNNNTFGFIIHTDKICYNDARDGKIINELQLDEVKTKVNSLVGAKVNYKNVSAVYNYYIGGYEELDDENKAKIDLLGLSKDEKGIKQTKDSSFKEIMNEHLTNAFKDNIFDLGLSKPVISLSENDLNNIFASADFVGNTFAFCSNDNSGYICLESLYCDIKDNFMCISLIVNINGIRLSVKANMSAMPDKGLMLNCSVDSMSLGQIELNDEYVGALLSYLENILAQQNFIKIDSENKIFTITLEDSLNSSEPLIAFIISGFTNRDISLVDKSNGNGEVQLILSK